MTDITLQQQLTSARLRHLFAYWAEAGGQEPSLEIVDETFAVLKELGDGDLEAAGNAVESFNNQLSTDRTGVSTAISQLFMSGAIDIVGIREGELVWHSTDKGEELYG